MRVEASALAPSLQRHAKPLWRLTYFYAEGIEMTDVVPAASDNVDMINMTICMKICVFHRFAGWM